MPTNDSSVRPPVYVRTLCNVETHVEMSGVDASGCLHPYTTLDTVTLVDPSVDPSVNPMRYVRPATSLQVNFDEIGKIFGNDPYRELYDRIAQASTNFWHRN